MTMPCTLGPREVHIWYRLTDSLDQRAVDESLADLSDSERSHYDRYRHPGDRRDYALAHSLLRASLSRYSDISPRQWVFGRDANGRPVHTGASGTSSLLTFSLSHTSGCVACAIAPGPNVGVDVERTDLRFDCADVAARYFGAGELLRLERSSPNDRTIRFIELWTLKEAYSKATGKGLSEPLPTFDIGSAEGATPSISSPDLAADTWRFGVLTIAPHFRVGVAIACPNPGSWTICARNLDAEDTTDGHCSV